MKTAQEVPASATLASANSADHQVGHQSDRALVQRLLDNVGEVLLGKPEAIRMAVIALLAEGHLLIEDVPGIGKTLLAKAMAKSLDCTFRRIQFTPDLLPS